MQIINKRLSEIHPYENNPRRNDGAVDAVAASIREFGFKVPIVIDRDGVIVAGHTRYKAAQKLDYTSVPCIIADDLTPEQVKAFRLADNKTGELATWDFSMLERELAGLDDFNMPDFGFDFPGYQPSNPEDLQPYRPQREPQNSAPDRQPQKQDWFDTHERNEKANEDDSQEYQDFVDKFVPKKTTDDCYTPDNVYNAVADWIAAEYHLDRETFVRPFYPGGDYQSETYPPDCVVVDNPPFSIMTEIIEYFSEHGVKFFLFAPTLTLFTARNVAGITFIPIGVSVTYENGANVNTSFITNLDRYQVRTAPSLYQVVNQANDDNIAETHAELPKYTYPDEIITSAMVARWCKYGIDYHVSRAECVRVSGLDAQKEYDKSIFGGGHLLSERAAAERAAAERAAAERAAMNEKGEQKVMTWQLSEREKAIVRSLGGNE